jgi:hypothetical protein
LKLTVVPDRELGLLLDSLNGDYTLLLFSDPNDGKSYEADFGDAINLDLKRREVLEVVGKRKDNSTSLPLFEKYQFFTPGTLSSGSPSRLAICVRKLTWRQGSS